MGSKLHPMLSVLWVKRAGLPLVFRMLPIRGRKRPPKRLSPFSLCFSGPTPSLVSSTTEVERNQVREWRQGGEASAIVPQHAVTVQQ